jgi:hypothetical protein
MIQARRHRPGEMADPSACLFNFGLVLRLHLPWHKPTASTSAGFFCCSGRLASQLHQPKESLEAHGVELMEETRGWRAALDEEQSTPASVKLERTASPAALAQLGSETAYTQAVVANNEACRRLQGGCPRPAVEEFELCEAMQDLNAQGEALAKVRAIERAVTLLNLCVALSSTGDHAGALERASESLATLERYSSDNLALVGALLGVACFCE